MMDPEDQARRYRALVLQYEDLSQAIQALMEQYGGHTENMPAEAMQRYRELAEARDILYNQIKAIEAGWLDDGEQ
ncbi:MAG: hypothetical protein ACLFTK_11675 [Anaerolineales bacterium]